MLEVEEAVDLFFPFLAKSANALLVSLGDAIAFERLREFFQRDFRVRDDGQAHVLSGVELRHIDVDEIHRGILKGGLRRRRKICVACSYSDDQVGVASQQIGSWRAGNAHGTQALRMIKWQRSLSGLCLCDGYSRLINELGEDSRSFGVKHPSTRDKKWLFGREDHGCGMKHCLRVSALPRDAPNALLQKCTGVLQCFRLHILRQAKRDRLSLHWRSHHSYCLRQRGQKLLGPGNTVPISRNRFEAIV